MRRILMAVAVLVGLAIGAAAQKTAPTILQFQNTGTPVFTGKGFVPINFASGCTASVVSSVLTINCSGGGLTVVTVPPSGSCTPGTQPQMVSSTGVIYTCQNSVWGSILSAGQPISAVNSGVVGEGHFSFNCSAAASSSSITCTDGNFTTNASVGAAIFCTGLTTLGGGSGDIQLPEGTITSINSGTNVTVSTTTTGSTIHFCGWGQYEDTPLSSFETLVTTACTMGQLPSSNPEADGPAVILVKHKHFYQTSVCSGTGGARNGFGYFGGGMLATYIMVMPSMVATDCVNGASGAACFGGASDGGWFHDFTIFGGGVSTLTGFTGKELFQMNPGNNSFMDHMTFLAWGAGAAFNGLGTCVELDGQVIANEITEDYCGDVGIKTGNAGLGATTLKGITAQDNKSANIWIAGQGSTNVVLLSGSTLGNAPSTNGVNLCVQNATSPAIVYVSNSQIGNYGSVGSSGESILVGRCVPLGSAVQGTGSIDITGSTVGLSSFNAGIAAFNSGNTIHLRGTKVRGSLTLYNASGSSFFDDCGNDVSGTTVYTANSGLLFGHSCSITGTAQSSGNIGFTSGWGTGPAATACSGDSSNFTCTLTVGTSPSGSNPVVTPTFPSTFWVAPNCGAFMTGGTATYSNFVVGTPTTTNVPLTFNGTPSAGQTIVMNVRCSN